MLLLGIIIQKVSGCFCAKIGTNKCKASGGFLNGVLDCEVFPTSFAHALDFLIPIFSVSIISCSRASYSDIYNMYDRKLSSNTALRRNKVKREKNLLEILASCKTKTWALFTIPLGRAGMILTALSVASSKKWEPTDRMELHEPVI